MIVERTCYRPKPGWFDRVVQTRRRASAVRVELGLPAGTIYHGHADHGRMVFWECRFATAAEHDADMAARDASPAFAQVRQAMRGLIEHFERQVLQPDRALGVVGDVLLDGHPVVPARQTFTSAGRELVGYLHCPPGPGPFPCLITNHGSTIDQGTSDVCRPGVAALLMSWGIASFLPHRRGYGDSPGPAWRDEVGAEPGTPVYDERLSQRLDAESDDVVAALDHVAGLPEVDPDHVGVMGSSFGGTVTLLAAAKDERFRCAVEFAGAAMNWEHAPTLRTTMLEACQRLTRPILFLQAANDYSARPTVELAAAAEAAGTVVEAKVYPGFGLTRDEGHQLYLQGPALWGPDVRRFVERWL